MTNNYPPTESYSRVIDITREEFERQSNVDETLFNREPNDNQTVFERQQNDIQTSFNRQSNVDETIEKRRRQTAAATQENREQPAITPSDFVKQNKMVVKLLNDKKFIKQVLGRRNLKYVFSLPRPIRYAINQRLHTNYTDYELDKIHISNQFKQRVHKSVCWILCIFCLIIGTYITSVVCKAKYYSEPGAQTTLTASVVAATPEIEKVIVAFEKRTKFVFYPYRKGILIKELSASNADNYENILQLNMAAQKQAQAAAKNKK